MPFLRAALLKKKAKPQEEEEKLLPPVIVVIDEAESEPEPEEFSGIERLGRLIDEKAELLEEALKEELKEELEELESEEPQQETETIPEPEPQEQEPEQESESEYESQESESETESEPQTEPEAETTTEQETDAISESETESETQTESETGTKSKKDYSGETLDYDFTSGKRYVDLVSTKTEFDKMLDELSAISGELLSHEVEKFAKQFTGKFQGDFDKAEADAKKYEAFLGGYITNAAMILYDNGYRDVAIKQLEQAKSILEARKKLEDETTAIKTRVEEENDSVDLSDILGLFGD